MREIIELREAYILRDAWRRWLVAMGALIVAGTLVAWAVMR